MQNYVDIVIVNPNNKKEKLIISANEQREIVEQGCDLEKIISFMIRNFNRKKIEKNILNL